MKKTLVAKLALAGTLGLAAAMAATNAGAAACNACHTMHNSQNGNPMRTSGAAQPLPKLLLDDCIGCHTGVNAGLITESPKIMSAADPGAATLAGGSFWYATQNDAFGHNVAELGAAFVDNNFADPTIPPGGSTLGGQITCAGTLGCHGDRTVAQTMSALQGAHHFPHNTVADATLTGASVGLSFRFLKGVQGREDTDWEFTKADDNANHNIYKGVDRDGVDETGAGANDATTVSSLCGQCHGNYHRQVDDTFGIVENAGGAGVANVIGNGQWIRHPTDFDMPGVASGTEYAGYNAYKALTPVGTANLAATIDVTAADSRIVLCVSCHRAHGSPNADLLRWDYTTMLTGAGGAATGTGCFACHTNKD